MWDLLGSLALPALGFGTGGIVGGSIAASIQGPAVAAGSLFAVLQSLGATGMGIVLFGSIGAAIGVISPIAATLGWCAGHDDDAGIFEEEKEKTIISDFKINKNDV